MVVQGPPDGPLCTILQLDRNTGMVSMTHGDGPWSHYTEWVPVRFLPPSFELETALRAIGRWA